MERDLRSSNPEHNFVEDAVLVEQSRHARFNKAEEIRESHKWLKKERVSFQPSPAPERERSLREYPVSVPDILPLHNTFISADLTRRQNDALVAVPNTLPTETYLTEGRGQTAIEAARRFDLIKFENVYNQRVKGELVRKRREAEEAKAHAEKQLSIFERLGTVLQLGREAGRRLFAFVFDFHDQLNAVVEATERRQSLAQGNLFESMEAAPNATPEQRTLLEAAQRVHKLASQLEAV